jgi:mono/diheme cytochrome c family protein
MNRHRGVAREGGALRRRLLSTTLAAGLAGVAMPGFGEQADGGILRPDDAAVVSRGAELYADHCASCHGASLEGQAKDWQRRDADGFALAPPHDASGHTWHHPDRVLFDITKLGIAVAAKLPDYRTRMPAYQGIMDDAEIVAVLSFIKAQWPDDIRKRHDALNARDAARSR